MTRVTTPVAAVAVVAAASLANQAAGHMIQTYPYSRQYAHSAAVDVLPDGKEKPFSEGCAACYNSGGMGAKSHGGTGGVDFVIARGKRLTDPDVLDANGGGDVYPLPFGEYAENGNYLESDEIAKRHGICGDPSSGNDEDYSRYGIASSNFDVYHEYKAGESFHIDILLWAYHWGHMEFFICNTDELPEGADSVPTQECFNKFPLDRDPDYGSFSPIDPDYYGRYHLDPECTADETNIEVMNDWRGWIARMHYLIPADLECEHCVLQAVYRTGHRCRHPGYADFNPSGEFSTSECAPDKDSWINGGGSGVCGEPDTLYAEEFWACTDMRVIGSGGGDTVPVETPENTAAPTAEQTAKETAEEATMPPVSGFMCSGDMGILRGDICCSPECEACGGTGCRRDPGGGASSCCMGAIRVAGEYCSDTGAAPCIVDSTTAPDFTCSAEMGLLSDDICCPVSCGTCGGPGCRERGGGGACCTNAVRIEGELCSVKREAPCIMD